MPSFLQPHLRIYSFTALWLACAILVIFLGFTDGDLLSDDGYYYFEIARNAALGQGFTFDGLHPTNGFHPLWAWLLIPFFEIFSDSVWAPIRCAQVLAAIFTACTGILMMRVCRQRKHPLAGEVAAFLWLMNPLTWVLSFRGLEGPLNICLLILSFLCLDRIRQRKHYSSLDAALMGLLVGMCLLARTDNIFWLASVVVVLSIDLVRLRRGTEILSKGTIFGVFTLGVLSPWLAWNLSTFGTVVQTSFEAKKMFTLYGQMPDWRPPIGAGLSSWVAAAPNIPRNIYLIFEHVFKYAMAEEWKPFQHGKTALSIIGAFTAFFLASACFHLTRKNAGIITRKHSSASFGFLNPLYLFGLIHIVWYALVSMSYYNWYFLPLVCIWCFFVALQLERLLSSTKVLVRSVSRAIVLLLAITAPIVSMRHIAEGHTIHQDEIDFNKGYGQLLSQLPHGTRTGLWNAGTAGYFASHHFPNHVVINLDGVVNNALTTYEKKNATETYLLKNVDVLIEDRRFLDLIIGPKRSALFQKHHLDANQIIINR